MHNLAWVTPLLIYNQNERKKADLPSLSNSFHTTFPTNIKVSPSRHTMRSPSTSLTSLFSKIHRPFHLARKCFLVASTKHFFHAFENPTHATLTFCWFTLSLTAPWRKGAVSCGCSVRRAPSDMEGAGLINCLFNNYWAVWPFIGVSLCLFVCLHICLSFYL